MCPAFTCTFRQFYFTNGCLICGAEWVSYCLQERGGVAGCLLQPPAETRYTVSEIECLAALEAIRHFLIYLDGHTFTLETDHRALEYLLSVRLTNKRLIRWALQLQGLNFIIRHRSGAKNANSDGISRQAWTFTEEELRFQGSGVPTAGTALTLPRSAPVLPVGDVGRPEATPTLTSY